MTGIPEDQHPQPGWDWDAYPPGQAPGHGHVTGYVPGYGPVYGPPPPGQPPPGPVAQPGPHPVPVPWAAWPHGPARPNAATTAAVLGFVTAGPTMLVSGVMVLAVLSGEDDAVSLLLTLGLPCAAGLITGAVRLQNRRSPALLLGSAVASMTVLVLTWLAGALSIDRTGGMEGLTVFVLAALVLPLLTAIFSWLPVVRGWAAARAG